MRSRIWTTSCTNCCGDGLKDGTQGLLFFGNVILPFVDHFPKDLELYRILTTKLNEISEGTQK